MTSTDIDGRSGILVRAPAGAFRALGAFGRPAYENFAQLQSILRGKASAACLAYFARPTFDAEQKEFRWTAPASGAIRPWRDLTDAERQAAESSLESIGAELAGLREQLRARGGQSLAYANLLDEAVKVPPHQGDEWHFLYVVGQQPVAAFWGFETHDGGWFDPTARRKTRPSLAAAGEPAMVAPPAERQSPPSPPAGAVPAVPPQPPVTPLQPQPQPQEEPRPRTEPEAFPFRPMTPVGDAAPILAAGPSTGRDMSWRSVLGGLLGLLLLGLLLALLLRGCGAPAVGAAGSLMAQNDQGAIMPPATAAAPPLSGAAAVPPAGGDAAADTPASPTAAPAPASLDSPAPTGAPGAQATLGAPSDAPAAPPGASPVQTAPPMQGSTSPAPVANSDLQGVWRAGEDLFDQNTGQPLDLTFAFSPDGQGKVTMRRPDGSTCSGAVTARPGGTRTTIEGASVPCAGGGSYAPPRIDCTRSAEGPLLCFGINPDGSRYRMAMRPAS